MAKVMPVAIRDETGAFIRQMAQGNEALAQLYTKLLAQYEERRANEESSGVRWLIGRRLRVTDVVLMLISVGMTVLHTHITYATHNHHRSLTTRTGWRWCS